jgi:hypothetical protein
VLSLTWLVPSTRKIPPQIVEKVQRRTHLEQQRQRTTLRLVGEDLNKSESVPRPESVRHVSFDEPILKRDGPPSAPASAPSSPRGRTIPLPRCKKRSSPTGTVSLPQVSSVIVAKDSPLSSAETLTELPTELKRTLSSRLTRVLLHSRGRDRSRASTMASVSSLSTTEPSEFGEAALFTDKSDNITERGMFGFLKKSKGFYCALFVLFNF